MFILNYMLRNNNTFQQKEESTTTTTTSDDEINGLGLLVSDFTAVLVVDNLPRVTTAKFEKLCEVLRGKIQNFGAKLAGEDWIFMPFGTDNLTEGFAFVTFASKADANGALGKLDGLAMDKHHILKVTPYDDHLKFRDLPETFVTHKRPSYQPRDYLHSWLLDARTLNGDDQFVIHNGVTSGRDERSEKDGDARSTEIYWFDPPSHELVVSRKRWTDTYILWSPLGTYLVTFDANGVKLWGGPEWTMAAEFEHARADLVHFSPNENYMVTFSQKLAENDDPKDPKAICVWDVRTGIKIRSFTVGHTKGDRFVWPAFQWSYDEGYCVRIGEGIIGVYEASCMALLNKKAVKVPGVKECCWSPSQNILAYFAEASNGNLPAKVVLLDIPSNKELCKKSLVNVIDCKMHWQSAGKYLAAKFKQHSSNKKSEFVSFALFRVHEKDFPVDILDFKDPVHAFSWEPYGNRFSLIHGDASRPNVSFYSMESKKKIEKPATKIHDGTPVEASTNAKRKQRRRARGGAGGGGGSEAEKGDPVPAITTKRDDKWVVKKELELIVTLERRVANSLFWSPRGRFIVLAGLRSMGGKFEFYDLNSKESFATAEHKLSTHVAWDPSGRYMVTSVSCWQEQFESGYNVFTFYGKPIARVYKEKFAQFLWRPRPNRLNEEEIEKLDQIWNVAREQKEKGKKRGGSVGDELSERERMRRKRLREEYYARVKEWEADREAHWDEYVRILGRDPRGGGGRRGDWIEIIEEVVEEVITVEQIIID